MRDQQPRISNPVLTLIGLQFFLSMAAFLGGGGLIYDPSGTKLGLGESLSQLPIGSYFLPGVFMLLVFGLPPLILIQGIISRYRQRSFIIAPENQAPVAQYFSLALIAWVVIQVYFIGFHPIFHTTFLGLAIALIIVSSQRSVKRFFMGEFYG